MLIDLKSPKVSKKNQSKCPQRDRHGTNNGSIEWCYEEFSGCGFNEAFSQKICLTSSTDVE